MLNLRGKKIAVLGLNRAGLDMIRVLANGHAQVTGFGIRNEAQAARVREALKGVRAELVFSKPTAEDFLGFDAMVDTPGGGTFHDLLGAAKAQGIPVFSDLDFVLIFMEAPIIAVTGTNGKSSTVAMIDLLLRRQGFQTLVLGGDFAHWSRAIEEKKKIDYYLLEISSRRLELSHTLKPKYAVLLNLFPAHGERHRNGLVGYYEAKAKIFANQTEDDFLIFDGNAGNVGELIRRKAAKSRLVRFGAAGPFSAPSIAIDKKSFVWVPDEWSFEAFSLEKALNRSAPHLMNMMAAIAVAKLCGVESSHIHDVLNRFAGLPHRLQLVRRLGKIMFFDDTRSTNPAATIWGLTSFPQPVIWIAGGAVLSSHDFDAMTRELKGKIKTVAVVGKQAPKLRKILGDIAPCVELPTLKEAVYWALRNAGDLDSVIFSPACPPDVTDPEMDRQRGKAFQKIVGALDVWDRVLPKKSAT